MEFKAAYPRKSGGLIISNPSIETEQKLIDHKARVFEHWNMSFHKANVDVLVLITKKMAQELEIEPTSNQGFNEWRDENGQTHKKPFKGVLRKIKKGTPAKTRNAKAEEKLILAFKASSSSDHNRRGRSDVYNSNPILNRNGGPDWSR